MNHIRSPTKNYRLFCKKTQPLIYGITIMYSTKSTIYILYMNINYDGKEVEKMEALSTQKGIALTHLIAEPIYYLNKIAVRYVYKDGKRTDVIAGHVYTSTNIETFDQINILVEGTTPLMPIEEFNSLRAEGEKVFVRFDNAVLRPYYNENLKSIQDSIKARAIEQVVDIDM